MRILCYDLNEFGAEIGSRKDCAGCAKYRITMEKEGRAGLAGHLDKQGIVDARCAAIKTHLHLVSIKQIYN